MKSIVLVIILFLTGCKNNHEFFIMPNGEKLEATTIENFEKEHSVKYEDYVGFTTNYGDSILNKYILLEEEESASSYDVLSKQQIEELKDSKINCLRFNILLRDSVRTYDSILKYVSEKYKNYKKNQVSKNEVTFTEKNKIICKLLYNDFANPNFAMFLYSN